MQTHATNVYDTTALHLSRMVVADLHVHTTNSDGTLTLDTLHEAAIAAGVEAVAITDHDRIHPELDSPVTTLDTIEVVHGIELRVDTGDTRVDLLGYGVERTASLVSLTERLQTDRIDRARRIVECVERRLDVELAVDFEPGVGRPHIARAIDASEAPYSYQQAFDELIGNDCPCYVSRDIPSFEDGRRILTESCGVVGLAHPLRYPDPAGALALTKDLDAVELQYPYGRVVDTTPVETVIAKYDLLATGGSDAHDETLGVAGVGRETYDRLRSKLMK